MLIQAFRTFWQRSLLIFCLASIAWGAVSLPAYAKVDPYIRNYLQVTDPVPVVLNDRGETRSFSAENLIEGKKLFELHCASCHVGGSTLPNPAVPLSLAALKQATPPRDTVEQLIQFMRQPMTYDGSEDSLLCREVPESWLSQSEVENLSGFILRAAEKAKGWGSTNF
ncbi:MAG: photosystem II cytochrome PsbV2 [Phormidium tanganyikae FI6-MK23]|jgi:photosystem II cytochrome c550|nr:photosystem II cytochrome PsbV2 [Phormidium tanganyikae FI6-MK23]